MPVLAEGISLVAARTALAAGTAVVGTVSIGGLIYYLVQASAVNPAVYKVLVDDGESDYDKIMAMEAARKLRAEQQAMLAATSATATATTAAFMGQPRGPSIFSTPPPPLFDPRLVTPIAMTGATFLTTPVATIPIWQEFIPVWTVPQVQLVTPIPDVPTFSVLFNKKVASPISPKPAIVVTGAGTALNAAMGLEAARMSKITGICDTSNDTFYILYKKEKLDGGEPYWGRTRGRGDLNVWGDIEKAVFRRDLNHHMNKKEFGQARVEVTSCNSSAIRGLEQIEIEKSGGAKSTGGTSSNKINGIAKNNPKRNHYLDEALKEFGDGK